MQLATTCNVIGCCRPAQARGMCGAHYNRMRRGADMAKPVRAYRVKPWARIVEASISLAEAETDSDFTRAEYRLRNAIEDWLKAENGARAA